MLTNPDMKQLPDSRNEDERMGLLECASCNVLWRGYDYFRAMRIRSIEETAPNTYTATVSGSRSVPYTVEIHVDHPRKSKCNCPHAEGKRIICKHMVATYFAVFPKEAEELHNEYVAEQEEEEKREEALFDKVCQHVWKMKKSEAQTVLLRLLFDGPPWQLDHFVREQGLDCD